MAVVNGEAAVKPRIAVMGTGAVGGYTGAHMVQAAEEVIFIDPWPAHVEAMRANGLHVSHLTGEEFTVPVRALHLTDVQGLAKERPVDIAFVCMKSYDTEWATRLIAQYLGPNGFVVSLQNCMNEATVASVVGWGRTMGCIASSITVDLCEPGHVRRAAGKSRGKGHVVFRTGEVHGRITPRAEEVRRLVDTADGAMVTTNLWGERWSKLVTNVMGNGLSACTGLVSRDVVANDVLRRFSARLGSEAIRVGQALGYSLEEVLHMEPEVIARAGEGDPE
ncbi:MAG: ketopantoate reductase family protein, partial [Trebonia sp.]